MNLRAARAVPAYRAFARHPHHLLPISALTCRRGFKKDGDCEFPRVFGPARRKT